MPPAPGRCVTVEAPGSIANIGPGLDILSLALEGVGDRVEVCLDPGSGSVSVEAVGLVPGGRENVAYGVVEVALRSWGLKGVGVWVMVYKGVPPGAGLGSSGASAAATAVAMMLFRRPFSLNEAVRLAGEAVGRLFTWPS